MWTLIQQGDIPRVNVLYDTLGAKACPTAYIDCFEVSAWRFKLRLGEGAVAHFAGPVERVDDGVVDDREEAVKPKGLPLVLNETPRSTFGVLIVIGSGDGHSEDGASADGHSYAVRRERGGKGEGLVGEGGWEEG